MVRYPKSSSTLVWRLMVALALLGCPRMGSAAGTWSVISLSPQPGEVIGTAALAVDAAGNLYVADFDRIQKRDTQGRWSVIATGGDAPGQVDGPTGLAVDTAGNLYVAEASFGPLGFPANSEIQQRDAQGHWSLIAAAARGQLDSPTALAVDTAGNLYVEDDSNGWRIQERDAQGNWSVIATSGSALGQVQYPSFLAADAAGNLYVAEQYGGRIQKRDVQGNWSVIATQGASALAVDTAGNLYVADWNHGDSRIQKRDARGNWSVIAAAGVAPGQVENPAALAVDTGGDLYVADEGDFNGRIQKRDAQGNCYENRIPGPVQARGTPTAPRLAEATGR